MTTFSVMIGNSDNKLNQKEWSDYCNEFEELIKKFANQVFFVGYSLPNSVYQNMCIVFEIKNDYWLVTNVNNFLPTKLKTLANKYNQDSIAMVIGKETIFV